MQYKKDSSRPLIALALAILMLSTAPALSHQAGRSAPSHTDKPQAKPAADKSDKQAKDNISSGPPENMPPSPREKKQRAMSLLEEVLATAHKITPPEYGILAEVEAAALLWHSDKDRAGSILKNSIETMRALLEEAKENKTVGRPLSERQRRLRFLVFLRIARLKPDLIKELISNNTGDKSTETIPSQWTEEARALMVVAEENINQDPELAAQLAEQSLSLGMASWQAFLYTLDMRDKSRAEQLTVRLINRLSNSDVGAANLFNLNSYALGPNASAQIHEQFFNSLTSRLRRDIRPDATANEITRSLQTARIALQAIAISPRWQAEFADIVQALEDLLAARNLSLPRQPARISIDTSTMNASTAGDTQGIADKAERAVMVKDSRTRDKEYQSLAFAAASNSDARLAEELLSKIENEEMRRSASLKVYSPLVRKELNERNWTQAQKYASKITHPLGRTIVFDSIAQAMPKTDKLAVKEIYEAAAAQLYREVPTEKAAKSFLFLAKSLFRTDPEGSLEAAKSAVYVLNKLKTNDELWGESEARGALPTWLRLPSNMSVDDAMDLTEMIGPLFKDLAKRDLNAALTAAYNLSHVGLYSLAQLGIVKGLLEEAAKPEKKATSQTRSRQ
ncbi:MAG: hypothetical protein AB1631_22640 [Acidobacteriota bacterium]